MSQSVASLAHYLLYAVGGVVAVALLSLAVSALVRRVRGRVTRARIVTVGLLVPAAMALSLSASTSYRYAGAHLGISDPVERFALCATVEMAVVALTVHAWGAKSKGSALIAYGFIGVQAIPAFEVSGGAGGVFRIAAGPVLLALLLHRLLGLELKFSGQVSQGLLASMGRELRERLTARLGIGRRGADSAEIARSRSADKAVRLASRRRLSTRTAARLSAAVDGAQHGLDEADAAAAEASVVARIVRRKSVANLHGLTARHVWHASQAVPAVAEEVAEEPILEPVFPVIYPLPQRPLLPSFQAVPGSFQPFKPQVVPSRTEEEVARALRTKGLSLEEIGKRLGRSKSWAHRACTNVPAANGSKVV